jgi:high-affinity nickel-transport protein
MTVGSTIALGFLLGMRHATDADHVAAVAATVGRERLVRPAAWIGVWWGVGHTITIVLVGAAIVLFNWIIEPRLGLAMEFGVGVMLVLLGVANLSATRRSKTTARGVVRPVLVGVVHGLAGSAAIALLVMTTIRDPAWAIVYLLVFGVGTIAGMSMITMAIAAPFASLGERSARKHAFVLDDVRHHVVGLAPVGFEITGLECRS